MKTSMPGAGRKLKPDVLYAVGWGYVERCYEPSNKGGIKGILMRMWGATVPVVAQKHDSGNRLGRRRNRERGLVLTGSGCGMCTWSLRTARTDGLEVGCEWASRVGSGDCEGVVIGITLMGIYQGGVGEGAWWCGCGEGGRFLELEFYDYGSCLLRGWVLLLVWGGCGVWGAGEKGCGGVLDFYLTLWEVSRWGAEYVGLIGGDGLRVTGGGRVGSFGGVSGVQLSTSKRLVDMMSFLRLGSGGVQMVAAGVWEHGPRVGSARGKRWQGFV
ncbi:hypothetical protein Tco_0731777 [Tanacetum coccineum]